MEDFQFYYQKKLVPFFGTDVFNEFVYLKPLGYAGDFIVSGYIYDNNYSGDSVFAKLIHKYSLSLPMAQAHFHRKSYLKDEIERCLKTKKNPRIISLGCGPAREIIEYLLEKRFLPKKYEIYCLDFEKLAIKCLKRRIRHIELKLQKKINIEYVGGNILEFVGSNKWQSNLGEFDLVYMAGVLDYFDNKIASHIIKNVFSSIVRPKGRFIVINVFEDSISRAYYELLGGWKLHHRNKANLLSLCKNIDFTRKITVSFCKKTKKNLYLTLVRK
jgi:extracellular factor (EF) 3-hydroxypalmitic acid methyl ester biosynthesis protein